MHILYGGKMIGIYMYENLINGKKYVGQSVDIERRHKEHLYRRELAIEKAIQKYGIENFRFVVLEECDYESLDKREMFWIKQQESYPNGYNLNDGGGVFAGENNGRARLTEEDVIEIRLAYKNKLRRRTVYEKFKDKVSFHSFAKVWDGSSWKMVMPEVYTPELKEYYSRLASKGELSTGAEFSNEEVLKLRQRYVTETAKEIYEDVKDRCKFQTLQQILWGRSYKDVPIYKKKNKAWISENL